MQETCERALACKDQWQPGAHLDAWMFRIAHSLWFERAKRVRSEPLDIDHSVGSDVDWGSGLVLADPLAAFEQLSLEQRAIIALVCVDGLTYTASSGQMLTVVQRLGAAGGLAGNRMDGRHWSIAP